MARKRKSAVHVVLSITIFGCTVALAAEPAWWTAQKAKCGIPSSTAYNTWVAGGSKCPGVSGGAASGLTSQQQLGSQLGALGSQMLLEGLFGSPEQQAAQQARQAEQQAAQQARQEEARQAEIQRQQQIERAQEESRTRLLTSLKGMEATTELQPRLGNGWDSAGSLPSSPGLALKIDDPEKSGAPVVPLTPFPQQPPLVVSGLALKTESANPALAPALDLASARIIDGVNDLAKRLGWSPEERARLDAALRKLGADGNPNVGSAQVRQAWQDALNRPGAELVQLAARGDGPGFPGAGQQTNYEDCAIFALANATGLPYGVVASRAGELIRQGGWRTAAERANPQKTIEQGGLNGGEVIMLAEAFGRAEVVRSADFATTLKQGKTIMVNVVPQSGNMASGHEVVLTKVFKRGSEDWYEIMESNQGPQRRLYMSARELDTILQENGVAWHSDPGKTPALLRASGSQ